MFQWIVNDVQTDYTLQILVWFGYEIVGYSLSYSWFIPFQSALNIVEIIMNKPAATTNYETYCFFLGTFVRSRNDVDASSLFAPTFHPPTSLDKATTVGSLLYNYEEKYNMNDNINKYLLSYLANTIWSWYRSSNLTPFAAQASTGFWQRSAYFRSSPIKSSTCFWSL